MSDKTKEKPSILVIGDRFTDVWVDVKPRQASAEAPIPIYDEKAARTYAGGAGNVISNLEALGGVDVDQLVTDPVIPTKIRFIDPTNGAQIFRVDQNDCCDEIDCRELEDVLKHWKHDLIIISDYNKGAIIPEVLYTIKDNYSGPIFVDTKVGPLFYTTVLPDAVFFPNIPEFLKFSSQYNYVTGYVRKLGETGAVLSLGPSHVFEPAWNPVKNPRSVCGAGDVFLACFAQQYVLGNDPVSCLRSAVAKTADVIRRGYDTLIYGNVIHVIDNVQQQD